MVQSEELLQRDVRKHDEASEWQLPEPGAFTSTKAFRDKVVLPLVNKLKSLVKYLTIQCVKRKIIRKCVVNYLQKNHLVL